MLNEQFEELKNSGKLPSPSGVGLRILVLTRSDDCSLDEIAHTLQADPALTGRILKLANSVLTAATYPSTHVRDAGIRLGLRTVCNVALGFSLVSSNRQGRCKAFDYDRYWSWSLANAVAAEQLSRELRMGTPGEVFTLGLLSRVGRLALASVHSDVYTRVLRSLEADRSLDLAQLEREAFCIHNREVAAAMADDWGLPPVFSEVLLHLGLRIPETLDWPESKTYLRVLGTSERLADVLLGGDGSDALWPATRDSLQALGLPGDECRRFYDEIGERWRDWGQLLAVPADFGVRADEIEARSRAQPAPAAATSPVPSPTAELTVEPEAEAEVATEVGLRILLVDDEPTSLMLVSRLLRKEGHQVATARDGHEALALALREPPQMVITDWVMPEMDGLELCKRLRSNEAGKNLYILILTGRNEEERIVEAFEAGADDYVAKPFNPRLLLARIRPGIRVIRLQENLQGQVHQKETANRMLAIEKRRFKVASMTDALTELPNRRYAMQRLAKEWATSGRTRLPLSVILLDIDHFKSVNDTYGHDVGDEVLRATAKAINRLLRTSDTCTRMGGEEFLVICPGTPLEGACLLAERIRAAVAGNTVGVPSFTQGHVTVSLGVACSALPSIESIDTLLKASDEAVYSAKRLGRNRVALPPGAAGEQKSA